MILFHLVLNTTSFSKSNSTLANKATFIYTITCRRKLDILFARSVIRELIRWSFACIWCTCFDIVYFHVLLNLKFITFKLENTIIEKSFFYFSSCEDHLSIAMLDTITPLSFINTTITPIHFTIEMPFVILVVSLIIIAWCPFILSITLFYIIFILSIIKNMDYCFLSSVFIFYYLSFLPFTFSMLMSFFEFSFISCSWRPGILSSTPRFSITILSLIFVTIGKVISSISML